MAVNLRLLPWQCGAGAFRRFPLPKEDTENLSQPSQDVDNESHQCGPLGSQGAATGASTTPKPLRDVVDANQTYLSEFDDDGAYGHVALGRSFALEMGSAIPTADQKLGERNFSDMYVVRLKSSRSH